MENSATEVDHLTFCARLSLVCAHERESLLGSNKAKHDWWSRVAAMDIDMLCPQHGVIYQGENVRRFIDWFSRLDVGVLKS